jgi:hypothetical protein
MKMTILTLFVMLLTFVKVEAQGFMHNNSQAMKKIEELEKIKIIDALGMDEQTSVRFFARRNEFKEKQDKLIHSAFKLLDQMDALSQKNIDKNDPHFKKLIDQYMNVSEQIVVQRNEFYRSLNNILSQQQIAKLLVFERKFREEIRDALFNERMNKK